MNITKNFVKFKRSIYTSSYLFQFNNQIIVDVFDRKTKQDQKNISALYDTYKDCEYLKEETGYRVADRIFDIKRSFNHILDLGSSRGYVTRHLTKETVKKVTLLESAENLLVKFYYYFNLKKFIHKTRMRGGGLSRNIRIKD